MADFQIITKTDIENLNLSKDVKNAILQGVNIEQMSIFDLEKMINNLINLLNKVMKQNQHKGKINYSYSFKNMRKATFRQIPLVGALLVFKIRQFLLQEPIIFSLGATNEKGKLFERQITQDELFQKVDGKRQRLRSSLSAHAILLSRSLEKYNAEDFHQVGILNQWPRILELAFESPGLKNQGDDIEINGTKYYQKDSMDKEVYIRYVDGKERNKQYYYNKNDLKYFNKGWLYEWYMEYISESPEREYELQQFLNKQTISPIIKKMDAIPGYKGGDYIAQGQQMQAKYNNQQMITYTSIMTVLIEMQKILLEWKTSNNVEKLSYELANLFTSDSTLVPKLNATYSDIIKTQLLSLIKLT